MLQIDRERIANIVDNVAASDLSLRGALLAEADNVVALDPSLRGTLPVPTRSPRRTGEPSWRYGKSMACGPTMLYNAYEMVRHTL